MPFFILLTRPKENFDMKLGYNFLTNAVSTSDNGIVPRILETLARIEEKIFGNGPTDIMHHVFLLNVILFNYYSKQSGVKTMLFDLHNDPEEKIDISNTHPEVLKDMLEALQLKMVIQ